MPKTSLRVKRPGPGMLATQAHESHRQRLGPGIAMCAEFIYAHRSPIIYVKKKLFVNQAFLIAPDS